MNTGFGKKTGRKMLETDAVTPARICTAVNLLITYLKLQHIEDSKYR
jgi:hypothetical protein